MPDQNLDDAVGEVRCALLKLKCELAAQRVLLAAHGVAGLLRKAGFNRISLGMIADAGPTPVRAKEEPAARTTLSLF